MCWNLVSKTEMPLSNVMKYNYSKADYAEIIEHLKEIDWELKFQDLDAGKMQGCKRLGFLVFWFFNFCFNDFWILDQTHN